MRGLTVLLCAVLSGLAAGCAQSGAARPDAQRASVPGYRTVADVPMPGSATRWEYEVLDTSSARLYMAHDGAGQVVIVDVQRAQVVATVPGLDAVHGLALAPGLGRLYATAEDPDGMAVIDLASDRVLDRVPTGRDPDGLAFVSSPGRVFVADSMGGDVTVVDALYGGPSDRVELGAGVGDSRYDPWSDRVLVTVASRHELVALDPRSEAVTARYALPGCEGADGLQVDVSGRDRAFVACDDNARVIAVDMDTGTIAGTLEVGSGPDVLALDPALHRLYAASESGVLTVAATDGPTLQVLARGWAGPDAHSVAVDPDTHRVYLPLASVGGHPALRILAPA